MVSCNNCLREVTFILKHLAKSKYCKKSYSEKDIFDLRKASRENTCLFKESLEKGPKGIVKKNKTNQNCQTKRFRTFFSILSLLCGGVHFATHQLRNAV